MTQSHIKIYFLTLSSIMFHHKWLYIVPCAIQQDLNAFHSKGNILHLLTPNSQSIPLSPPPSWQLQVCFPSPCVSFLWKGLFVLYIRFQIWVIYGICLSLSDVFHLVWEPLVPFMLVQMAWFYSLLWLSNIPLCIFTTSS